MQVWELNSNIERVRHHKFSGTTKVRILADGRELYLDDAHYEPERNVFCLVAKELDSKENGIHKEDL